MVYGVYRFDHWYEYVEEAMRYFGFSRSKAGELADKYWKAPGYYVKMGKKFVMLSNKTKPIVDIAEDLEKAFYGHTSYVSVDDFRHISGWVTRPVGYDENGDVIHGVVDFAIHVIPYKKKAKITILNVSVDVSEEDEYFAEQLKESAIAEVEDKIKDILEKHGIEDIDVEHKV